MSSLDTAVRPDQIKSISVNALWIDKPLPAALRDSYGRVVLASARILSTRDLEAYGKAIRSTRIAFVGPDWPDSEAVVAKLKEAHGAAEESGENRAHPRHLWTVPLDIEINSAEFGGGNSEARVETRDISSGGFSFTSKFYINTGATVRAKFESLPGNPVLTGRVQSCIYIGYKEHRIGVAFHRHG